MQQGPDDDAAALVANANQSFYDAFENLDQAAMDRLWADRPYTAIVHPGRELILGWVEVRRSLGEIFAGAERIRFRLSDVLVTVRGTVAWVTALENIRHGDDVLVSFQATNLFEHIDGEWRMVMHHASPLSDDAGEPDTDYLQ
jgi:ketosteroid isomerase-like protein